MLFRKALSISLLAVIAAAALLAGQQTVQGQVPKIPKFTIKYFDVPGGTSILVSDINNLGQVVGSYRDAADVQRTYLMDPAISPHMGIDLEVFVGGAGIPEGWELQSAGSISHTGVIFGTMHRLDPVTGLRIDQWPYIINSRAANPEVIPIPDPGLPGKLIALRINVAGDLLIRQEVDGLASLVFWNPATGAPPATFREPWAGLQMGNPIGGKGAVVGMELQSGEVVRWYPDSGEIVSLGSYTLVIFGMNDWGTMVGQILTSPGLGKPFRMITAPPQIFTQPNLSVAWDINNANDFVLTGPAQLYRDDRGLIPLTSYVTGTKADVATWKNASSSFPTKINDRDTKTKYGQIAGRLSLKDASGQTYYQPYVLTPVGFQR
jgi:hypothetical protein